MKSWKAELSLFAVTFLWGATFLCTKIGLDDCPASLYIVFRFAIALIISLFAFRKHLNNIDKSTLIHGLILGLFLGGGFLFQTFGLKYTTVSKSAFITGMSVVFTPFVYWFIEKNKIFIWQKVGVVIATLGLWLFTNPQFDNINLGDFLTLMSTFFWAYYICYMDVFTRGRDSFHETSQLVIFQLSVASIVALLYFLIFEVSSFSVRFSNTLLLTLAFNGIGASFFSTVIHTSIQRYTTPVKAVLIFALEPVIASYIAVLFINESLSSLEFIGAVVLFLGVLVSELGVFLFKINIFILKLLKKID